MIRRVLVAAAAATGLLGLASEASACWPCCQPCPPPCYYYTPYCGSPCYYYPAPCYRFCGPVYYWCSPYNPAPAQVGKVDSDNATDITKTDTNVADTTRSADTPAALTKEEQDWIKKMLDDKYIDADYAKILEGMSPEGRKKAMGELDKTIEDATKKAEKEQAEKEKAEKDKEKK